MNLYSDAQMTNPINEDHTIRVPDPLFVAIEILEADHFTLKMHKCWAAPTPHANETLIYDIIENYHENTEEAEAGYLGVIQNCENEKGTFWMQSFAFRGYEAVYLHCQVDICDQESENCSCTDNYRRRRSESDENVITLGPINILEN